LRLHTLNFLESKSNYTHPIDSGTGQHLLRPAFKESGKESHKIIAVMAIEHDLRILVQQGAFCDPRLAGKASALACAFDLDKQFLAESGRALLCPADPEANP
jgi:hypothetical protein